MVSDDFNRAACDGDDDDGDSCGGADDHSIFTPSSG